MAKLEITSVAAADLPAISRPHTLSADDEALVTAVIAAAVNGNAAVSPMLTDPKGKPLASKQVTSAGSRIKRLVSKRVGDGSIVSARTVAKGNGFAWAVTITPIEAPAEAASAE